MAPLVGCGGSGKASAALLQAVQGMDLCCIRHFEASSWASGGPAGSSVIKLQTGQQIVPVDVPSPAAGIVKPVLPQVHCAQLAVEGQRLECQCLAEEHGRACEAPAQSVSAMKRWLSCQRP